MLRRLLLVLAIGSLVADPLGVSPAAAAKEDCKLEVLNPDTKQKESAPTGCGWDLTNYTGKMMPLKPPEKVGNGPCVSGYLRSVFNSSKDLLVIYGQAGCTSDQTYKTLKPGEGIPDVIAYSAQLVRKA